MFDFGDLVPRPEPVKEEYKLRCPNCNSDCINKEISNTLYDPDYCWCGNCGYKNFPGEFKVCDINAKPDNNFNLARYFFKF